MAHSVPRFVDIKEAAALSGRHANTIKRWGRAGRFKWSKPARTRNAPWLIDRASFIACMCDESDEPRQERDLTNRDQREVRHGILRGRLARYLPEGFDFELVSVGVFDGWFEGP
jgi:hypothetical protein